MVVRFFTRVAPAVAVGTAAVTIYCTTASAFFPPIPNGSDTVTTPPTSPIVSPPPVVPPVPPPPFVPPPTVPPPTTPVDPCDCNNDPCSPAQTPEPATIISGLVGLGAIAAAALRKKLSKPADAK